ncbi:MAG: cobyrinic acid a,c-diamide synthase [Micavibrio aeruginosavorus]|uniref:Cobyrinic acid a,c-diamide synthase n=1 Tax=Micavibrio aeruginosavorus TaxID=349221 RepID=A0A2W5FP78_9BACT|nr:MAG: cobyrinic acid a,c-diamide synthase [Micavibrio aeruginosavorus]
MSQGSKGKIITIAQHKGGAGKTTLSTQIAAALSCSGTNILLLDLDPQGSSTEWFKAREQTLGDKNKIHHAKLQGWRLMKDLAAYRDQYDYVIIDTPPHAESESSISIRMADLVLIPVQPSPLDIWACAPTLKLVLADKKSLLIVLNRVPSKSKLNVMIMDKLEGMGIPVSHQALGNRVSFAASIMMGLGVVEYEPRSTAADEIRGLINEIQKQKPITKAA